MNKMLNVLAFITLMTMGAAAAMWLVPSLGMTKKPNDIRFGLHEGLELVNKTDIEGNKIFVVEDASHNQLFAVPVNNCMLDVRFRNGKLRFRENGTNREGYIDRNGNVTFTDNNGQTPTVPEQAATDIQAAQTTTNSTDNTPTVKKNTGHGTNIGEADLRHMAQSNPFYKEAVKVLSGKLTETDAQRRHMILNYCEHLRTAYTGKDIDFLKQVFSDHALIIVGNVVRTKPGKESGLMPSERVTYSLRTKKEYIEKLGKAFATNKNINVKFSDFSIMRHPTKEGIYGVSLRQHYKSDRYTDDGYLFLLWDFRNKSMPLIHVRTWQPAETLAGKDDVINIRDFNLE